MQSRSRRALYIGVTSNLEQRVFQHKHHDLEGFTSKYNVNRLVYFERYSDMRAAIDREKQLKRWTRSKKETLIQQQNPEWNDLSSEWGKPIALKSHNTKDGSTPLRSAHHDAS